MKLLEGKSQWSQRKFDNHVQITSPMFSYGHSRGASAGADVRSCHRAGLFIGCD